MNPTPQNWGVAYAKQALEDFQSWNELQGNPKIAPSQKLHFLQMACEKLCKAHLCKRKGADPGKLQSSHSYIAKNLDIIVREQLSLLTTSAKQARFLITHCRHMAREIELLHPSVDDGGQRPDNCEYPWEQGGQLYVPAVWSFPALNLLDQPAGRSLLKLILTSIGRLTEIPKPSMPSAAAGFHRQGSA